MLIHLIIFLMSNVHFFFIHMIGVDEFDLLFVINSSVYIYISILIAEYIYVFVCTKYSLEPERRFHLFFVLPFPI